MTPMKTSLVLLFIILAIAALYQYIQIRTYGPIGEKLAATTQGFSIHPANPTARILVLGDSLAVGVGATSPSSSIAGRISQDYPQVDITNVAVSGSRVHDVIAQITPFTNDHFDLIVIQIGGNDVTHFTSLKNIESDMKSIMAQAHAMSPHVIVYSSGSVGFAPIFTPPSSWILTLETQRVYSALARIVTEAGGTYVNLYVSWINDLFKTDTARYYAPDHFHVTSDAYAVWYGKIRPKIAEVL